MELRARKRTLSERDMNVQYPPDVDWWQEVRPKKPRQILKAQKLIITANEYEKKLSEISKESEKEDKHSRYHAKDLRYSPKQSNHEFRSSGPLNTYICEDEGVVTNSEDLSQSLMQETIPNIHPFHLPLHDTALKCNSSNIEDTLYSCINDGNYIDTWLWFSCDYLEDIIESEFQKDVQHQLSPEYCKRYNMDPARREILVEWLVNVQTVFKAGNNTLHLTVNLMDLLFDKECIPLQYLQVSAMAAFWVAYKFMHGHLSMKKLMYYCSGVPAKEHLREFEQLLVNITHVKVGGDMITFFNYVLFNIYGKTFPAPIYYCGQYLMDVMLQKFIFVDCMSSEKAMIAAYTTHVIFDHTSRIRLFNFTRFISKKKLLHMVQLLLDILKLLYSDRELLQQWPLFKKYKSHRYHAISADETLLRVAAGL